MIRRSKAKSLRPPPACDLHKYRIYGIITNGGSYRSLAEATCPDLPWLAAAENRLNIQKGETMPSVSQTIEYRDGDTPLSGLLLTNPADSKKRPGLFLVHAGSGL